MFNIVLLYLYVYIMCLCRKRNKSCDCPEYASTIRFYSDDSQAIDLVYIQNFIIKKGFLRFRCSLRFSLSGEHFYVYVQSVCRVVHPRSCCRVSVVIRTIEQVFMKFGMDVVPLEATSASCSR
jgi:hypothetical protein